MIDRVLSWGKRGTAAATIAARLTFENLVKKFDQTEVLSGINLDIEPAEVVCLLGPSGGGKSTLLRIAAGIERASSGRVLFNHKPLDDGQVFMPPEKRGIGLMFQDFALFPHMTILDNVLFGLNKLDKSVALHVAETALERVGLAHYAKDYPHVLSGGEQQRIALARAIAPRPGVLLMDEPFSGLDARLKEQMRDETMAILRETRATCLIVTHQGEEAMRMGDKIAVIQNGLIVQAGKSQTIYENPASVFVARLFSELNEISVKAVNGSIETPFGNFDPGPIKDGEQGVLCLRHRGIELVKGQEGTRGRVIDRKYLGDTAMLEIAVEGLENQLLIRLPTFQAPGEGDEVRLSVLKDKALCFKA